MNNLTQEIVQEVVKALQAAKSEALILEVAKELETRAKNDDQTQVTSTLELALDQKDKIREKLGVQQIDFRVDESILGGLIIEKSGKRQDLSLRRRLNLVKKVISS